MSHAVFLTGTPVVPEASRRLRAGSLDAVYSAGSLRWLRWNGVEILRGISFLVRTPGWGTPAATISDLEIIQTATAFTVSYKSQFGAVGKGVAVAISINGDAAGNLRAEAEISAQIPFETNRSGFVILHPLDGFAGTTVRVDHASAPVQDRNISRQISPGQPVMDLRAITHIPVEGLQVETTFAGDIFEMEDHRNWTDASFKIYNRPIGLPYPYVLSPDEIVSQSVTVHVRDTGANTQPRPAIEVPEISGQRMPRYALPLDTCADAARALHYNTAIEALAPTRLLLRIDPGASQGAEYYRALAQLMQITGAQLDMQVIVASTDAAGMAHELKTLSHELAAAEVQVRRISSFAKIDEQSFQPGDVRPPHPSEAELAQALARYFPGASRIGGTPAFFTEFNRKRPTAALWDGVTFATSPVVHAADDASVMETLQSLPHVLFSAQALADGRPISVGPVGIGMRLNPYGSAPVENDPLDRAEMAARDPRQRGLFAAAWIVGYLTRIVPFEIESFAFGAPTGPFGLISDTQEYARPFWDDLEDGALYPLYHVARWITAAGGARLLRADTVDEVACLIWERDGQRNALIANLTDVARDVPQTGLTDPHGVYLDAANLVAMSKDTTRPAIPLDTRLDAYAVLYLSEAWP